MIKNYDYFKDSPDIKKTIVNEHEIISIKEDAKKRFDAFLLIKDQKEMAKYCFENMYEALRELADCIANFEGLKFYSHEISISYLSNKKILDSALIDRFDSFRRTRNKSKYYGEGISFEKLHESIEDMKKIKEILIKKIDENKKKVKK